MIPDVEAVGALFPHYDSLGQGSGNLLSYGVFDLDGAGQNKLFAQGRYTDGQFETFDADQITEYVKYSKYTAASGQAHPSQGVTEPDAEKTDAYSWIKSPRYIDKVHEAGPIARMKINGDYTGNVSILGRIVARALEAEKVALAMDGWLDELVINDPVYQKADMPVTASGIGLTEAPRGALGHWIEIENSKISRYQVITPTNWNASPKDDFDQHGPIEQALIGMPIADTTQPVEVLRVIHSFDPCLSCAVHLIRPDMKKAETVIHSRPSI
jgi:hydrogenase large subunit